MRDRLHVVGIGGGTGLSTLLRGLREHGDRLDTPDLDVTAIVSVADDGGSTGRLREAMGIPAVGDLRQCLAALTGSDSPWSDLVQHRFRSAADLGGHALGNLMLAALVERDQGLQAAIDQLAALLRIRGRVLAVTEQPVTLAARRSSGEFVTGESRISQRGGGIERLWLTPRNPAPTAGVLEAIAEAHAIVLGPGSLYTSIAPNLLVAGVAEAIRRASGLRIFVCNLTTQAGETDDLSAADHLDAITRLLGDRAIDVCLHDDTPASDAASVRGDTVRWDAERVRALGARAVGVELRGTSGRHDPALLARAVVDLARAHRRSGTAPSRRFFPAPVPVARRAALVAGVWP